MNTNDQWFEPGDKVMRVAEADKLGLRWTVRHGPDSTYGRVLCVADCWQAEDGMNRVLFIGQTIGTRFYAACFRRVSEIKLCVRAAESLKRGTEQPSTVEVGV